MLETQRYEIGHFTCTKVAQDDYPFRDSKQQARPEDSEEDLESSPGAAAAEDYDGGDEDSE